MISRLLQLFCSLMAAAVAAESFGHRVSRQVNSIPISNNPFSNMLNAADKKTVEDLTVNFMSKWQVPGASLAFGKNEKLVYANGFGYADLTRREPATVNHTFRIASVSKPIASVAVLTLVEAGRLSLDDLVFGPTGRLGNVSNFVGNVRSLRVRHLLQHTAGVPWHNDGVSDVVFENMHQNNQDFINWVLRNYPLQNAPGTTYAYSNFGYFLLALIVERVSGLNFDTYVKTRVFAPMGITAPYVIGPSATLAERRPMEVVYYKGRGNDEEIYGLAAVGRTAGSGDWVMNAKDLIKFLVQVDGFPARRDILQPSTIRTMTQGSTADPEYALGWIVDPRRDNWSHFGAMAGSSAVLERISNPQYSFAMIANTLPGDEDTFLDEMEQLMTNIFARIRQWPIGTDAF